MEDWGSVINNEKKKTQGENCNDAFATGKINTDENSSQLGQVENGNEKKCMYIKKYYIKKKYSLIVTSYDVKLIVELL